MNRGGIPDVEENSVESSPTKAATHLSPHTANPATCENEGYISSESFNSQLGANAPDLNHDNGAPGGQTITKERDKKGPARAPLAKPEIEIVHTDSCQDTVTSNTTSTSGSSDKNCLDSSRRKTYSSKDEVDRASIYSYYMDKNFRYYFQHPYLRLFFAYFVTFCNFLIYAEDPVAHSEKECFIPVVGNCFAFVSTRYPPNAWVFLKVFMWLLAIAVGLVVGKLIVHQLVFCKAFKLHMFVDDQGSWMTMFFTTIVFLFIFSWIYNGLLMIGGDTTDAYWISSLMGIKNGWFMKAAATGTWCGDFFTAWMVTDIMLQEKLYPNWAKGVRKWWNTGYNRILLFWFMVIGMSTVVITVISTDWIQWDRLNKDFLPSNELSRGLLASFILVFDLLIVMQDWDFPHFINNMDIKLPGLNTSHIRVDIPKCLKREAWVVHISGKWFNYGIIFIVMILDLNMWKNQIFYSPYEYGQYSDGHGKIHTIRDKAFLDAHNETHVSFDWRSSNFNPETNATFIDADVVMNSRYYGFSMAVKSIAFMPSILACICFVGFIFYFGRVKPTAEDPHGGRLNKRKKSFFARASRRWREAKIRIMAVRMFRKQGGAGRPVAVPAEENNYELVDESPPAAKNSNSY